MKWEEFMEKTEARYDRLIREGKMTVSSRVIPLKISLKPKQWVLPSSQALQVLKETDSVALADCICRQLAKKCSAPLDVCFYLGAFARKLVERGEAREISLEEAEATLKVAEKNALVHLALYDPERKVYALCSCCGCCCHDFHLLKEKGRRELVAHSDFVAVTDVSLCNGCGECVPVCHFNARRIENGALVYDEASCYGCGLCVVACSAGATAMAERNGNGA